MKFIAADIILLIVGVLLIGGAMAGLANQPGGLASIGAQASPSGSFNVTFAMSQANGETKQVPSFMSGSAEFSVTTQNLTKLTFAVDCNDPAPAQAPDVQITVNVEGPNGLKKSQSGACGDIAIEVPVTPAPQSGLVVGDDETEARGNLAQDPNATKGTGTWRVTWTGARDTAALPPVAGQFNPSGSIATRLETWNAELTPTAK